MLCALRHPNIVTLHAAYESPARLYLVTELASGGELMRRLGSDSNRRVYSEDEVRVHVRTIVGAVKYMHAHGAVHRDLKPANVLLSDTSPKAEIRIVDLGLARFFGPEESLMHTVRPALPAAHMPRLRRTRTPHPHPAPAPWTVRGPLHSVRPGRCVCSGAPLGRGVHAARGLSLARQVCGTRKYLAPELVRCDRGEARGDGSA